MTTQAAILGRRRLMLVGALIVGAFALFFPARQLLQQRATIVTLSERLIELRAENQRLEQDVKLLSDPAELEVLARERLGLVRPGERAYFVEPTDPPRSGADVDADRSVWSLFWSWLGSIVRGDR
jgi:cell division protein FtsB